MCQDEKKGAGGDEIQCSLDYSLIQICKPYDCSGCLDRASEAPDLVCQFAF